MLPTPTLLRALLCVALLAGQAGAQLKLPRRPPESPGRGSVASYRTCLVCGARNYTHPPSGRVDAAGNELAWCDACKRDTPQSAPATGPGLTPAPRKGGELRVPDRASARPPGSAARPVEPADAALPGTAQMPAAAAFIFRELARAAGPDSALARKAVESLAAMGADGLAASRIALLQDESTGIVVAARVLLRGGESADADLVVRRLAGRLPSGTGAPLLAALVATDPVRANAELFARLLDHPQAALRHAAARELERSSDPELLAHLAPALASSRAETRLLALNAAAPRPGEAAAALALDALDDPNARVVLAAVAALALREESGLDAVLLERALGHPWVLRSEACALLAIAEREDARLEPLLTREHAEPLLAGLESSDAFVAGACAAALAGIGFRAERTGTDAWLDGPVVDSLVDALAAPRFHADLPALVPAAVRRLELLSGQRLGPDGRAWAAWWLGAREGFRARNASLAFAPGEEGSLVLRYVPAPNARALTLLGPELASELEARSADGDALVLSAEQALAAVAALEREGVLAGARLPGAYAADGVSERTFSVAVGAREKRFTAGARARAPWFERCASLVASLVEQNRWQLFPAPARTLHEHWLAEAPWWREPRSDAERDARLARLALAHAERATPLGMERALAELERCWQAGAAWPGAEEQLTALLAREAGPGARTQRIAALLVGCQPEGTEARVQAMAELAGKLADQYGDAGRAAIAALLSGRHGPLSRVEIRNLARDPRVVLRMAAADALAAKPSLQDGETLLALLGDREPRVQCAAAAALGEARLEAGRNELLSLARLGQGAPRCAALRAAGQLGGDWVLDALLLGLAAEDAEVRRAAAEGLGSLGEPSAARALVSLLGDSTDPALRETARASLVRLGEPALAALRQAAEVPGGSTRREAALALAALGSPDAVAPLLALLSEDAGDARVADELTILTCVDARATRDALSSWWSWWEGVRHDDALAWFRAALERLGLPQPEPGALDGAGTRAGRLYLLALAERPEPWLAERACREYARLAGRPSGTPPAGSSARAAWARAERARIESEAAR